MIKVVVLLVVFVSVLGFSKRSLFMSLAGNQKCFAESLPGSSPLGFFDPLGLSLDKQDHVIRRWRESEIKHGRLAMLATVGILVSDNIEENVLMFGDRMVAVPAIYQFQEVEAYTRFVFAAFIFLLTDMIEGYSIDKAWETTEEKFARDPQDVTGARLKPDYINGDLGFDPFNLKPDTAEDYIWMHEKELNNGRLAMIGVTGMIVQELISKKGILESFGDYLLSIES